MIRFIIQTMDVSTDDYEMIDVTLNNGQVRPIHYSTLHKCQMKYNLSFAQINLLCSTNCWTLVECDITVHDVDYIIEFNAVSIEVIKLVMEVSSPDFELFKHPYAETIPDSFDHEAYQISEAKEAIADMAAEWDDQLTEATSEAIASDASLTDSRPTDAPNTDITSDDDF